MRPAPRVPRSEKVGAIGQRKEKFGIVVLRATMTFGANGKACKSGSDPRLFTPAPWCLGSQAAHIVRDSPPASYARR